jgi:hypothetical protein
MPSGTDPGAAALFATVGANSDGLVVIVARTTGGFESRPRQIHATTTSDATTNPTTNKPTRALVDNSRFVADDLEIERDTFYPKRKEDPGTTQVYA